MYAYDHQIDETNIRELWDIIVKDVCENKDMLFLPFINSETGEVEVIYKK